jgi:hypothetical protein
VEVQVVGVMLNVFVFAVVVAKFQKPNSDLVWSTAAVVTERNGRPTLLIRVGCVPGGERAELQ